MTATATTVTFTKLRNGAWGVKGYDLRGGSVAYVTKRSGEIQAVTVDRVMWSDHTGLAIASIVSDRPTAATARRTASRRRSCPTGGNCSSFGNGRSCGAPDCDGF